MKNPLILIFVGIVAAHAADSPAPVAMDASVAVVANDLHAKGALPLHISHGQTIVLKDYLVTGKTTIFDFYSDYCPPCRALSPLLEQLHKERTDVAVVKVDINRPGVVGIDWDSPVAHEFGLQLIPNLEVYSPNGALQSQGDDARNLVIGWIQALN